MSSLAYLMWQEQKQDHFRETVNKNADPEEIIKEKKIIRYTLRKECEETLK